MNEEPMVIIHGDFAPVEKKPEPTIWDWIKYYAYNVARKPLVWKKKKELEWITTEIQYALRSEFLPALFERRTRCPECRDAYMALKPQVFVSMIETNLRRMACPDHQEEFAAFLALHGPRFKESDDIAAWINGFK